MTLLDKAGMMEDIQVIRSLLEKQLGEKQQTIESLHQHIATLNREVMYWQSQARGSHEE